MKRFLRVFVVVFVVVCFGSLGFVSAAEELLISNLNAHYLSSGGWTAAGAGWAMPVTGNDKYLSRFTFFVGVNGVGTGSLRAFLSADPITNDTLEWSSNVVDISDINVGAGAPVECNWYFSGTYLLESGIDYWVGVINWDGLSLVTKISTSNDEGTNRAYRSGFGSWTEGIPTYRYRYAVYVDGSLPVTPTPVPTAVPPTPVVTVTGGGDSDFGGSFYWIFIIWMLVLVMVV